MPPKVLISDALSPAAVQIFRDRGVAVDFQPKLGADKEKLAELVGQFDGLAIRSATKVTPKVLEKAKSLKVIGRAGIGVDNVDIPAATAKGIIVMNTPFGNSITTAEHAITPLHRAVAEKTQTSADRAALAPTKKGVGFVNCARGGLVDEQALRTSIDSGHVAAAAFDVFVEEPAKENPLFGHPNVVCTPDLGA